MLTLVLTTAISPNILNVDAKQQGCSGGDRYLTTPGKFLCIPGQANSPTCVPSEEYFPPQTCLPNS